MRAARRAKGEVTRWIPAGCLVALALASGGTGCGSESPPEARLERAGGELEEARETLSAALERRTRATEELHEARRAVREAESRVLSAEQLVARRATDAAVFRAVQSALLEDPALRQEAVSVRIEDATAILEGEVASEDLRERAIEIATKTPGVQRVQDAMDVVEASPAS